MNNKNKSILFSAEDSKNKKYTKKEVQLVLDLLFAQRDYQGKNYTIDLINNLKNGRLK